MAPYVERHRAARRVIDMVDVDSEKWRHYAEATSGLSRTVYAREARTLLALERRAASAADSILFDTPAEERLPAAMQLLGIDYARLADQAGHA